MSEKEQEQMTAANKAAAKAADADAVKATDAGDAGDADAVSTVDTPPKRAGEDFRQEWADANGVDPKEMREIHAIGGWVDYFDGRGWVKEGS